MKTFAATASALALLATGAYAQATDTVTLNATVGDYIAITSTSDSTIGDLDITAGSGVPDNSNVTNAAASDKALFEVTANVDYNIELDWLTWDEITGLSNPGSYSQAAYDNGDCFIGGTVSFDPDPSPGVQNDRVGAAGGATPLTVPTTFNPGIATYGVNTEASPNVTTCPGDVAAPGTYSLDVEITVSAS